MQVSAAIVHGAGEPFVIEDVELDELRPDEVRVRMVAVGVCHTDANIRDQMYPTPLPAVLGHEGAGIVDAVGELVKSVSPGDHVLLSSNSCGSCRHCVSGEPAYCEELFARNFGASRPDGTTAFTAHGEAVSSHFFGQSSFSTVANVAARSVVRIPKDVDLTLAAPLGCGIQTGAGAILNELRPGLNSAVAVVGAGAVGAGAIMGAVIAGCRVIVAVDVVDERLELARELGATHTINALREDVGERLRAASGGQGLDAIVDSTGRPDSLRTGADALAIRGKLGLVGAAPGGTEVLFEIGDSLNKGWTFQTIIQGSSVPQTFIPALIELWRQGRFPFDRIIRRYSFADINDAFADAHSGATVKPVLTF